MGSGVGSGGGVRGRVGGGVRGRVGGGVMSGVRGWGQG